MTPGHPAIIYKYTIGSSCLPMIWVWDDWNRTPHLLKHKCNGDWRVFTCLCWLRSLSFRKFGTSTTSYSSQYRTHHVASEFHQHDIQALNTFQGQTNSFLSAEYWSPCILLPTLSSPYCNSKYYWTWKSWLDRITPGHLWNFLRLLVMLLMGEAPTPD